MTERWHKSDLSEAHPAEPYEALAQIYDQVMDHVDYRHWAHYILKLALLHGKEPELILDVSCGTGSLDRALSMHNLKVLACDASLAMIRRARQREQQKAQQVLYWCCDMRRLSLRIQADVILSLYDSMNYLLEADDWIRTFMEVHRRLNPSGLFIFDISTLHNSLETFADYLHEERTSGGYYRRTCYFDAAASIQYNYFTIYLHNTAEMAYSEVHRQRIRSLEQVDQLISQTPFKRVGTYSDFSLKPGSEKADRVHYVLQKRDD